MAGTTHQTNICIVDARTKERIWCAANNLDTIRTVSASFSVTARDRFLLVDASSAQVNVQLFEASAGTAGKRIDIKRINGGLNSVVISGGLIDGESSQTLSNQYDNVTLTNNGVEFFIL